MNRRNLLAIIGILAFIMVVGGISYSYFVYNKDIGTVSLSTGKISIDFSDVSGSINLNNVMPLSDIHGKVNNNYLDFTINSTVDTEKIYYEIYLLPKKDNTLDTKYLKTYLTDQNDVIIRDITLYNSLENAKKENGKVLYKGTILLNNNQTTKHETKDFRLRLWLDESFNNISSKTFDFDIYLYAINI